VRIIIERDYAGVSCRAADFVEALVRRKPKAVLGFATGSTPLGLYRELIRRHKEEGLDFSGVTTFNLDEYCGLAPDHPQSYHRFMRENLFDHINVRGENINIPSGTANDVAKFCEDYERKIRESGGIDLQILGIGSDGHIAFNEPGSSLASRTRIKALTQDTIIANSRFFDNDIAKVPKTALTVGVATVMDSREVMIIASGYSKARALQQVIECGVNHMWTASCLQLHPHGIIVCDEAATIEMKVGTVNYFKDIEQARPDRDK